VKPNDCRCSSGYASPDHCEFSICGNFSSTDFRVCSRHGMCGKPEQCECEFAYFGHTCEQVDGFSLYMRETWFLWVVVVPILCVVACAAFLVFAMAVVWLFVVQARKLYKYRLLVPGDVAFDNARKSGRVFGNLKFDKNLFIGVKASDIKIIALLGKGGSGSVVYKAKWNFKDVAYKRFELQDIVGFEENPEENQRRYKDWEGELNLMLELRHPRIVQFFGAVLTASRVGFLMELCVFGDLKDFLEKNPDYPLSERVRMITEIASAMEFLHAKEIIHRDLKCQNVLVAKDKTTRLMDFGLSRRVAMNASKTVYIGLSF